MEIKIIATGEEISGLVEFSGDIKPICDKDHTLMVWGRIQVDYDSSYPALTCPGCSRRFTQSIGYHTADDKLSRQRIPCANDQSAMVLTAVSEEGETWSCTVAGCGRIELHT